MAEVGGPFGQGNGLRARAETVAAEVLTELEKLNHRTERVADALEEVHREELRGEVFSRTEAKVATAAGAPLEIVVGPSASTVWIVEAVGLLATDGAGVGITTFGQLYLGETTRPIGGLHTDAAYGGGLDAYVVTPCPFTVDRSIIARIPNTGAIGERYTLHVVGRELANDGGR